MSSLRLLYLDTDAETVQQATRGKSLLALHQHEVLLTRLHRPSHYVKPQKSHAGLESWLQPKDAVPHSPPANGQRHSRSLGRLAFVDNYRSIARRLQSELEGHCCTAPERWKKQRANRWAYELLNTSVLREVYIVSTNLAGGTGSGMFIDVALPESALAQLRETRPPFGGNRRHLLLAGRGPWETRRTPELANTFAALRELSHFSSPHSAFSACYDLGEVRTSQVFQSKGVPFQRCQFFALPEARMTAPADEAEGPTFAPAVTDVLGTAAHLVFTELATPLGRLAEELRQPGGTSSNVGTQTCGQRVTGAAPTQFQMCGIYRLVWPRRQLLHQAATAVCRRLVQRWMTKDARALKKDGVKQWVEGEMAARHTA